MQYSALSLVCAGWKWEIHVRRRERHVEIWTSFAYWSVAVSWRWFMMQRSTSNPRTPRFDDWKMHSWSIYVQHDLQITNKCDSIPILGELWAVSTDGTRTGYSTGYSTWYKYKCTVAIVAIRFHQNDVIIWYSTYVSVVLEYCLTLRSTWRISMWLRMMTSFWWNLIGSHAPMVQYLVLQYTQYACRTDIRTIFINIVHTVIADLHTQYCTSGRC